MFSFLSFFFQLYNQVFGASDILARQLSERCYAPSPLGLSLFAHRVLFVCPVQAQRPLISMEMSEHCLNSGGKFHHDDMHYAYGLRARTPKRSHFSRGDHYHVVYMLIFLFSVDSSFFSVFLLR